MQMEKQERNTEYRNKNNIKIKEYSKIYREENREKLKTKKHLDLISS